RRAGGGMLAANRVRRGSGSHSPLAARGPAPIRDGEPECRSISDPRLGRRTPVTLPDPLLFLCRQSLRRPRLTLAVLLAATAFLALGLPRLQLRTAGAAIYPSNSPPVVASLRDRELFDDGLALILLVVAEPSTPPLTSPAGLRAIRQLHEELALHP